MTTDPSLPSPMRNVPFLSFLGTQFLGAFNDNVFKQAVLLLAVTASTTGVTGLNFQLIVGLMFTLPFVVFTGLAGDLADRYSKGTVIVICKVAEIVVMALGVGAFLLGQTEFALWALAALAGIMGTQSAFFGPAKYAVIPELVRDGDIAPAAGMTQMTTMIAIIVGIALAGLLLDSLPGPWMIGLICAGIAVLGTLTSLGITRNPAADPERRVSAASMGSMFPTLAHLWRHDRALIRVFIAYSFFWLIGAMALSVINDWGLRQLGLSNFETSLLVAVISLGIGVGSVVGGMMSQGGVRLGLTVWGMIGMALVFVLLGLIPVPAPVTGDISTLGKTADATAPANPPDVEQDPTPPTNGGEVQQERASVVSIALAFAGLFFVGAAGGFYSVPLLAFVQVRPKDSEKGRVMAASQWVNWVFILAAQGCYGLGASLSNYHSDHVFIGMGLACALFGVLLLPRTIRSADKELPPELALDLHDHGWDEPPADDDPMDDAPAREAPSAETPSEGDANTGANTDGDADGDARP